MAPARGLNLIDVYIYVDIGRQVAYLLSRKAIAQRTIDVYTTAQRLDESFPEIRLPESRFPERHTYPELILLDCRFYDIKYNINKILHGSYHINIICMLIKLLTSAWMSFNKTWYTLLTIQEQTLWGTDTMLLVSSLYP